MVGFPVGAELTPSTRVSSKVKGKKKCWVLSVGFFFF
jgi:hypothetical protein